MIRKSGATFADHAPECRPGELRGEFDAKVTTRPDGRQPPPHH
ncbi:hypothetical protein [Aestuariivirga sp.]|nr:hypothetical protein [Aestuariivirga sp.]